MRQKKAFIYFSGLISGAVLVGLILPFILAGEIYDYQDTVDGVHLPQVDAIVCLAGGRGRISAAGDVWNRYREQVRPPLKAVIPVLYISGMGQKSNFTVFSKQLRKGVRDIIRPDNVVLEVESTNTEANAVWLAKFAAQKGWKRILLVTSPYHMKRSVWIFDQVLKSHNVPLKIDTLSVFQEPFEPGEWRSSAHGIHVTLQEFFKWVYYRWLWTASGTGRGPEAVVSPRNPRSSN